MSRRRSSSTRKDVLRARRNRLPLQSDQANRKKIVSRFCRRGRVRLWFAQPSVVSDQRSKGPIAWRDLITILVGLIRALQRHDEVIGLRRRQGGQLGADLAQV